MLEVILVAGNIAVLKKKDYVLNILLLNLNEVAIVMTNLTLTKVINWKIEA